MKSLDPKPKPKLKRLPTKKATLLEYPTVNRDEVMVILTYAELTSCCTYWQRVLRLQDWDVVIRFAHAAEMPGTGQINFNLERRSAVLKVILPEEYGWAMHPDRQIPQDMEYTVVHELLHLHMAPLAIKSDSIEERFEEQMIHALAHAIVQLKRARTQEG